MAIRATGYFKGGKVIVIDPKVFPIKPGEKLNF
jgi:hypothetical protein